MEVSKLQGQMPLFVKPQIKDEKTAFVQKQSSKPDNAKQIVLSLAALAAVGAAFVIGKKTAKVKEIVKEVIKEVPKSADETSNAVKNEVQKAAETAAKKIENIEEFYPTEIENLLKSLIKNRQTFTICRKFCQWATKTDHKI